MKYDRRKIMQLAWQFVKRNGYTLREALQVAWCNIKLLAELERRIVHFYFQKVDGSPREAFGTLMKTLLPPTSGDERKRNDTVQVYYDTERQEYRCFKKANLLRMV